MSETKTMGQVLVEAIYKKKGWLMPIRGREILFEAFEEPAAAVIAAHRGRAVAADERCAKERNAGVFGHAWQ